MRRRALVFALVAASVASGSVASGREPGVETAARVAKERMSLPVRGLTPSGARYGFSARRPTRRDLKEPLGRTRGPKPNYCLAYKVSNRDGSGGASTSCTRPAPGRLLDGGFNLDCETRDFVVFGRVGRAVTTVRLRRPSGREITARLFRPPPRTQVSGSLYLFVSRAGFLPARVKAFAADRTLVEQRRLGSRVRTICGPRGQGRGSVFGSLG